MFGFMYFLLIRPQRQQQRSTRICSLAQARRRGRHRRGDLREVVQLDAEPLVMLEDRRGRSHRRSPGARSPAVVPPEELRGLVTDDEEGAEADVRQRSKSRSRHDEPLSAEERDPARS
jgi:hypothetical protein